MVIPPATMASLAMAGALPNCCRLLFIAKFNRRNQYIRRIERRCPFDPAIGMVVKTIDAASETAILR